MKVIKVPCEIWSRVVGYFRPLNDWNKGKREEFNERKMLSIKAKFNDPGGRHGVNHGIR